MCGARAVPQALLTYLHVPNQSMTRLTLLWQQMKDNYLVFHWHQQIYLKTIIDAYNEEIFSIPDYAAPPCRITVTWRLP